MNVLSVVYIVNGTYEQNINHEFNIQVFMAQ